MNKHVRMQQFLMFTLLFIFYCGSTYAQEQLVTVNLKSSTLRKVFKAIEQQTTYRFSFRNEIIDNRADITVNKSKVPVEDVLNQILKGRNLGYSVVSPKSIVVFDKKQQQNVGKTPIMGTVKDILGEPIIGASMVIKGVEHSGTITDINGEFSIAASMGDVLVVSYLGYVTQEVTVNKTTPYNISMKEDAKTLDEVVVIGYGSQKKVNLTGAVSSITSENIAKRQVGQASAVLQGMIPGLTVTQRSGQPGADEGNLRIRGVGTLNNAAPLVLVDGIQMDMNTLDVNTIESISVLKDASSASIYGSRAANGVVLITTKRAKEGKFSFSYNGYVGFQTPTNLPKKVDAVGHMTLLDEAYTNAELSPIFGAEYIKDYMRNHVTDPDRYPNTDWQDEILNGNGFQTNHSLSVSGGTEKLKIFATFSYMKQNGLIKPVDYRRYSFRINADMQLTKWLAISTDLFVYDYQRNSVAQYGSVSGNGSGIGLIFGMMNKLPATYASVYSNGLWAEGHNGENPVALLNEGGSYRLTRTPIIGNFTVKLKPTSYLTANLTYSPVYSIPHTKSFVNTITTYAADGSPLKTLPDKNYLNESYSKQKRERVEATLVFNKTFAKRHNMNVLGGFQYESSIGEDMTAYRDDFMFPDYPYLSAGSTANRKNTGTASEWALLSYFGRVNYDYAQRYLLEANVRYDGSSRFTKGNRWGVFPSVSVGWRISEEAFMESTRDMVDNLKFRVSWGKLGNQDIGGNYPFATTITLSDRYISGDAVQDGAAITSMANQDISWEETAMINAGLEATLFKNFSISFDYYWKKTTGILMTLDIPKTMGVSAPFQNAGMVKNHGWDLQLSYNNTWNGLKYGATFVLSDVHNKVVDLKGIQGNGTIVNREGHPINSLYLYEAEGLITEDDFDENGKYKYASQWGNLKPGDIRYKDNCVDGVINEKDKVIAGNTIPRFTYSLNLNLGYKNFDFQALLQGVGKVDGYLTGSAIEPFYVGGTAYEYHYDRWTKENPNPNATFPRLSWGDNNNYQPSTFWKRKAAYMRVKNIQLGYTLPKKAIGKLGVNNVRFYVSGENLLTLSNFFEGWDPEIAPGSNGFYYPQVKAYNLGLNVSF